MKKVFLITLIFSLSFTVYSSSNLELIKTRNKEPDYKNEDQFTKKDFMTSVVSSVKEFQELKEKDKKEALQAKEKQNNEENNYFPMAIKAKRYHDSENPEILIIATGVGKNSKQDRARTYSFDNCKRNLIDQFIYSNEKYKNKENIQPAFKVTFNPDRYYNKKYGIKEKTYYNKKEDTYTNITFCTVPAGVLYEQQEDTIATIRY